MQSSPNKAHLDYDSDTSDSSLGTNNPEETETAMA
jgi:hypothetical protein